MRKDTDSIKCVILTLRKENVLLPNALVAEILSVKDVQEVGNVPDWYLGKMNWRGAEVPLLSFEAAAGVKVSKVNLNTQAVVLYAVGTSGTVDESPYLALVMSGVPVLCANQWLTVLRPREYTSLVYGSCGDACLQR